MSKVSSEKVGSATGGHNADNQLLELKKINKKINSIKSLSSI
jgi:hypothetical protein